jgi:hypothetical protein
LIGTPYRAASQDQADSWSCLQSGLAAENAAGEPRSSAGAALKPLAAIITDGGPMRELAQLIPDPQILLNLQPEELAGKMLFLFRKQLGNRKSSELHFVLSNMLNDLWRESYLCLAKIQSAGETAWGTGCLNG